MTYCKQKNSHIFAGRHSTLCPIYQCWNFRTKIYGTRTRVGIGLSYRPAGLYIGWRNRFLGFIKVKNIPSLSPWRSLSSLYSDICSLSCFALTSRTIFVFICQFNDKFKVCWPPVFAPTFLFLLVLSVFMFSVCLVSTVQVISVWLYKNYLPKL
jgi:hypothetical protein